MFSFRKWIIFSLTLLLHLPFEAAQNQQESKDKNMTKNNKWPFLILRHMGAINRTPDYAAELFKIHDRFPGVIEEIWFSSGAGGSWWRGADFTRKRCEQLKPLAEAARKRGIMFSIQQNSLGHGTDPEVLKWKDLVFKEDDWVLSVSGKREPGTLCPTSPRVLEVYYKQASIYLKELKPSSFWPDDDMRLDGKPFGCFCPRCLERFNRETGRNVTREMLRDAFWGNTPDGQMRHDWIEYNSRRIADFAAQLRKAVDDVYPECRLGRQANPAFGRYNGYSYQHLLKTMAGKSGEVGIRPGGGFYSDSRPREMLKKAIDIARESSRCIKYGFVRQICYEAENYPHISMLKTPEAEMIECAMMLFAGADSLALYWHDAANRESPENSHFFLQTVAEFRPYFETIRDTVKDLPLGGIAFYRGNDLQNSLANDWVHTIEPQETPLWENAIPMGVPEAEPEVYAISERTVRELTAADLQFLSRRTTLIDVKSFRDLQNRFPKTKFLQKVNCIIPAVGTAELFDGKSALGVTLAMQPVDNTVKPLSTLSSANGYCGSCIIPTDNHGYMIVIQRFSDWTGYRRKAILDAVDSTLNGGLSIRLEPGGFAIAPMARMTEDGKTAAAFLINTSIGKTPILRLKIRRPAFREWELLYFDKTPVKAKVLSASEHEIELELPALRGWEPVMIKGKN